MSLLQPMQLSLSPEQTLQIFEASGDTVLGLSKEGRIVRVLAQGETLRWVDTTLLLGEQFTYILTPSDVPSAKDLFDTALSGGTLQAKRLQINGGQGVKWAYARMRVLAHLDVHVILVLRDETIQVETEKRLQFMATHDAVTKLPNRMLLQAQLRVALVAAQGFSLLSLDIEGFKKINHNLGHAAGDLLLCAVSARVQKSLRSLDVLARGSGTSFHIVLPAVTDAIQINAVGQRILSALQAPFEIDGHRVHLGGFIGATVSVSHMDSPDFLISNADRALLTAKEKGKGSVVHFADCDRNKRLQDVTLDAAMHAAVQNGEFYLDYQPLVDSVSGQVLGLEALMRWQRAEHGLVSPAQFIPMAEDNGLIHILGAWALKAACFQAKQFHEFSDQTPYVSVNVSPVQFKNKKFLESVALALDLADLSPQYLLLEITEGALMTNPAESSSVLEQLTEMGVRVAVDDFGTGYSSLAYLKQFPVSVLKIDRAFVKDLPQSTKDEAICRSIVTLATLLGLTTVAEGVETSEQLEVLASWGVNIIQGYFTGRPLSPAQVQHRLAVPFSDSSV